MVSQNVVTWPIYTNKTYYDVSSGNWDSHTDLNGTLSDPYDFDLWPSAADVGINTGLLCRTGLLRLTT